MKFIKNVLAPIVTIASIASLYAGMQYGLYNMKTNSLNSIEQKQGIEKTIEDIRNNPAPIVAHALMFGYFKARNDYLENNKEHWK